LIVGNSALERVSSPDPVSFSLFIRFSDRDCKLLIFSIPETSL
jgi:hypothetical protein